MKIGRNAPCPCGSGKKYKKCCLERDEQAARERASAQTAELDEDDETGGLDDMEDDAALGESEELWDDEGEEERSRIRAERQRLAAADGRPRTYLDDPDIRSLVESGVAIADTLVRRLLERGRDVVQLLNEVLRDVDWLWSEDAVSDIPIETRAWAATHAAYIAAAIGDPSSVAPLLEMAAKSDDDDWLNAGVGWFVVAFPSECIPAFLAFCLDAEIYWFHKATCVEGVVWAAGRHPEYRELVASSLADVIDRGLLDPDDESTTWLAVGAARTGDSRVIRAIERAFDADVIDEFAAGERSEILGVPGDWYLDEEPIHETLEDYLASVRTRAEKGSKGG
jgi:hypothetical protein